MFGRPGDERGQVAELARHFRLRAVSYTRAEGGSLLHSEGLRSERPGEAMQVADTVGAGDFFTAALALGILSR
jgi:fructokinase